MTIRLQLHRGSYAGEMLPAFARRLIVGCVAFDRAVLDGWAFGGAGRLARLVSRALAWADTWMVDGSLRLAAWTVVPLSHLARRLQKCSAQGALLVMTAGLIGLALYCIRFAHHTAR